MHNFGDIVEVLNEFLRRRDLIWPAVKILLIVPGWALLAVAISCMSGWRGLAEVYRAREAHPGEQLRPLIASMRGCVNYHALMKLSMNEEGLSLSMSFLFRPGHPPLFVPWTDIAISPERQMWVKMALLRFKGYPSTSLLISRKLGERIRKKGSLAYS